MGRGGLHLRQPVRQSLAMAEAMVLVQTALGRFSSQVCRESQYDAALPLHGQFEGYTTGNAIGPRALDNSPDVGDV